MKKEEVQSEASLRAVGVTERELGYPHDLLVLSSRRAKDVLQGNYRYRTKIYSALFLSVQGQKPDLGIDMKDEYLSTLISLAKRNKIRTRMNAKKLNRRIGRCLEDFENTRSSPSFSALNDLLRDSIYMHLISKEMLGISILSSNTIERSIRNLEVTSELRIFLALLLSLDEERTSSPEVNKITGVFVSAKESPLMESALLLSFILAGRHPRSKSEFLLSHYIILKTLSERLGKLLEHKKVDDPAIQKLFAASVALSLCGYMKSLRLSHQEKINYLENVAKLPLIEHEVERTFQSASKIKIWQLELPLWTIMLTIIVLTFLHVLAEIYAPSSINIGTVSFQAPPLPIFLTIAIILLFVAFYKILRLKRDLLRSMRRGD